MSYRSNPKVIHTIIIALVILIAVLGGAFYYASRMDPAYVPEDVLPAGWYLDSTEQGSARFGFDQLSRYVYVKNAEFPAALSIFTFHYVLPQLNDTIVKSTMNELMVNLTEEQEISITNNSSGVRGNSFYVELEGERRLSAFEKEYLNVYGEFCKDGYGTYVMCIGFAKVGERSLLSRRMDARGYEEIKNMLIPAIRQ
ncbi:MAG: hypothetical protein SVE93_07555 [Candidatus Thermoplasmatota archaeon]|nr:hypothetical protein [Candidatus Thermoplasmatota archaeon]